MSSSTIGSRGKSAEKLVSDRLEVLCKKADTAFYRLPDARAGSLKATLADFLIMQRSVMTLLEVKEVDHPYRLPHKNFAVDKVSRMRRFRMAGAKTWVLVHFTPTGKWRAAELEFFLTREGGSWDMRQFLETTLEQALEN